MPLSMFRPAASASEPRSWHRSKEMDARTIARDLPEYCLFHEHAEGMAFYLIFTLSRYQRDRAPLDVDSTVQVVHNSQRTQRTAMTYLYTASGERVDSVKRTSQVSCYP